MNSDHRPDDVRLSDLKPRFVCSACGKRGADVRPDFNWNKKAGADDGVSMMVESPRILCSR
jgi:uncharacterized Fe-S cluster-containing protein